MRVPRRVLQAKGRNREHSGAGGPHPPHPGAARVSPKLTLQKAANPEGPEHARTSWRMSRKEEEKSPYFCFSNLGLVLFFLLSTIKWASL